MPSAALLSPHLPTVIGGPSIAGGCVPQGAEGVGGDTMLSALQQERDSGEYDGQIDGNHGFALNLPDAASEVTRLEKEVDRIHVHYQRLLEQQGGPAWRSDMGPMETAFSRPVSATIPLRPSSAIVLTPDNISMLPNTVEGAALQMTGSPSPGPQVRSATILQKPNQTGTSRKRPSPAAEAITVARHIPLAKTAPKPAHTDKLLQQDGAIKQAVRPRLSAGPASNKIERSDMQSASAAVASPLLCPHMDGIKPGPAPKVLHILSAWNC